VDLCEEPFLYTNFFIVFALINATTFINFMMGKKIFTILPAREIALENY